MRYLLPHLIQDLERKMVFISGPRQCGKTTLAKHILKQYQPSLYLNWDDVDDKKTILQRGWSEDSKLIALDEIHKYPRWKNWLKGTYDKTHEIHHFLVTGSARLDIYRRGGDSLLGRYHSWRLHPFCLSEAAAHGMDKHESYDRLLRLGGFPEPFFSNNEVEAKRWRRTRRDLVLREDIRDLEKIREITLLSLLLDLLAHRVGGPVVVSNLAEDLQVAPKTVAHWIEILEQMYLLFQVKPFTTSLPRAIRKTPKIYFFDNAEVESKDSGAKLENLVATHLLKKIHFLEDSQGDRYELNYLRDKEGHEVDFVIVKNRKPVCLIEVKHGSSEPHSGLKYFGLRVGQPILIQLVKNLKKAEVHSGIRILNAMDWLSQPLEQCPW